MDSTFHLMRCAHTYKNLFSPIIKHTHTPTKKEFKKKNRQSRDQVYRRKKNRLQTTEENMEINDANKQMLRCGKFNTLIESKAHLNSIQNLLRAGGGDSENGRRLNIFEEDIFYNNRQLPRSIHERNAYHIDFNGNVGKCKRTVHIKLSC